MQIRLSQALSVGVGVVLFDLVFCGLIAPKVFEFLGLSAEDPHHCCAECEGQRECKNVTNRSQVIDMSPVTRDQFIMLPGAPERMV